MKICLMVMICWAGLIPESASGVVPDHAVIFMYHHVSDTAPPSTSVPPALFERHLDHLAENGFRVLPLPEVAAALAAGRGMPDSVVVITFDDGYRSVYEEAFPRLRARGWPFTVFVASDAIDQGTGPVLTWAQLKEMGDAGATIASHGRRHDHLQRLRPGETRAAWRERTLADLETSQRRIRAETGQEARLVAYPYGEFDDHLLEVVGELGWIGCGQQSGAAGTLGDLRALPRFPMAAGFASMDDFPLKAASLPLPVVGVEPDDLLLKFGAGSVILGAEPPVLRLTLAASGCRWEQVAAYAGVQGRALVRRPDDQRRVLEIQAPGPLPAGRSRYNVTAPAEDAGRWCWYSYTWIVGDRHGD